MICFASVYRNFPNCFLLHNKRFNLSSKKSYHKIVCRIFNESLENIPSPIEKNKKILYANCTIETVISELQNTQESTSFSLFCKINRHYINYSLLYRLTSLKLRAEADKKIQNQSFVVDNFRNKILEKLLMIDQPVSHGFILAEKRLKYCISNENFEYKTVIDSFGKKSIEISCFWIVLNAALTAWDNKKFTENNLVNSEIYSKMKIINQILYESEFHQRLMPVEIKLLDINLNRKETKTPEDIFSIEDMEGLMLIICNLEKMPASSYSFFLQKLKNITQKLFFKNFGKKIDQFEYSDFKFVPTQIEPLSKLIEIKPIK